MLTLRRVVLPLRVFLVLLFGILVVFQTMSLPGQFAYMARESPDQAYLRWPLTAVTVSGHGGRWMLRAMQPVRAWSRTQRS